MKSELFEGYKYIGTTEGVCSGDPIILGTRLRPLDIVKYGTIDEVLEDFNVTKEQVEECYKFFRNTVKNTGSMVTQTEIFDDYQTDCIDRMNEFLKTVDMVDIKMNTVVSETGNFFTRYLVIYRTNA